MYQNKNFRIGPYSVLTPAVKNLILANGIIYLMTILSAGAQQFFITNFALFPRDVFSEFKIWQLVSYMFLHDPSGIMHILFNVIFLWMFGSDLEREWGNREFLKYYFITGIGAGLINIIISSTTNAPTIGASGAIYGIMLAYALRYPEREIYLYFLIPVKIKYFMGFLILVSFFSTFGSSGDGIAHAAHLGGIVVGYAYLRYGFLLHKIKSGIGKNITNKYKFNPNMKFTKGGADKTEYYRRVMDQLLDKMNKVGYLNLSEDERDLLNESSQYLREHDEENYN